MIPLIKFRETEVGWMKPSREFLELAVSQFQSNVQIRTFTFNVVVVKNFCIFTF